MRKRRISVIVVVAADAAVSVIFVVVIIIVKVRRRRWRIIRRPIGNNVRVRHAQTVEGLFGGASRCGYGGGLNVVVIVGNGMVVMEVAAAVVVVDMRECRLCSGHGGKGREIVGVVGIVGLMMMWSSVLFIHIIVSVHGGL